MLYGRTQRNEPSRFLREIEPEYIEETRSPALERRSSMGWGSSYSDTVPGGASGLLRRVRLGPQFQQLRRPHRRQLSQPGIQCL